MRGTDKRPYVLEVLIAFDQLGNALAGGNCDQTVSGRVGWHANYGDHMAYWRFPQMVINWGLSPVDGKDHCLNSIEHSVKVSDHTTAGLIAVTALSVGFAVPIGVLLRARAGFIWCRDKLRSNFN